MGLITISCFCALYFLKIVTQNDTTHVSAAAPIVHAQSYGSTFSSLWCFSRLSVGPVSPSLGTFCLVCMTCKTAKKRLLWREDWLQTVPSALVSALQRGGAAVPPSPCVTMHLCFPRYDEIKSGSLTVQICAFMSELGLKETTCKIFACMDMRAMMETV